ncbi:MAG: GNAT family N-acetyltransferase [Chloroflexota bacterium]|nr:GNAT family N-acetyltransferase [Chloroflexota bacterium]
MPTIRAIDAGELDAFARLDQSTPDLAGTIRELWAEGSSRPDWTLVAEDGGTTVGRVALLAEPLGCGLPIREGRLAALWVHERTDAGARAVRALVERVSELARGEVPFIERRLNAERDGDIGFWQSALTDAGFSLFQEKRGFVWTDTGQELPAPERLVLRSVRETGVDAYAAAMAATIPGTLDGNDQFYLELCGPEGWGREMVGALEEGDEDGWLLAYEPDGNRAGYVAVGRFEEGVGTIVHIGVAPERRGRGYVDELLRAANRAARQRGYGSVLSDVDVANAPMLAAMERNGHRAGVRPWHVWAYRREIPAR